MITVIIIIIIIIIITAALVALYYGRWLSSLTGAVAIVLLQILDGVVCSLQTAVVVVCTGRPMANGQLRESGRTRVTFARARVKLIKNYNTTRTT